MKKNEELLQRCFDGDLNDDEMKYLFSAMSNDEMLREQFRSLQTLRTVIQSLQSQNVPTTLDDRIKRMSLTPHGTMPFSESVLRRIVGKKFILSIPAIAATVLILLAGSYFVTTKMLVPKAETEFVYIMQLPQVEVLAIIN